MSIRESLKSKINPYIMTIWEDHIIDFEDNDLVIQEGTRFTAKRANNIEEGIYNLYGEMIAFYDELNRIAIQLEMLGRSPTNNGTFFDPIEGGAEMKALELLLDKAVSQYILHTGDTEITVDSAEGFEIGQNIFIVDEENSESVRITDIQENVLKVTALKNNYKKGAYVMRSNVAMRNNKLVYGEWITYNISAKEVI